MNQHQPLTNSNSPATQRAGEKGFSLLEAVISSVLLTVSSLAVASAVVYSVNYNSGAADRVQAMAVGQQRLEQFRSARFTISATDTLLAGGTRQAETFTAPGKLNSDGTVTAGRQYLIEVTVDDAPATAGVQVNTASNLKEIVMLITPLGSGISPNRALSRVRLVTQRSRLG